MQLEAGCQLIFQADGDAPLILMLRPRSGAGQWVMREEYRLEPTIPVVEYTDSYGNLCQRLMVPKGKFQIYTVACVETSDDIDVDSAAPYVPVEQLPDDVLQFLLASRYCPSDKMYDLASKIVGDAPAGYAQVEAIREWIQTQVRYEYGTTNATTDALEAANQRAGVCRDFAHLGISLCRALTIPARMVVGYLYELEPMDLHAWFEAFVGDRWFTFDATQSAPRGNRITIAYGRDAADVALATQFGPLTLNSMTVWVKAVGASTFTVEGEG